MRTLQDYGEVWLDNYEKFTQTSEQSLSAISLWWKTSGIKWQQPFLKMKPSVSDKKIVSHGTEEK